MAKSRENMIPEAKQPIVVRALQEAFGTSEYEDIQSLSGGLSSALAYKILVRKKPYLLKILRTEVISDPRNEFACMQAGAEAGIAPRIWYANVDDRIMISDFLEAQPFPDDMLPLIVPTLRTLHSLPPFPKPMMGSYFDAMNNGFVRRFQEAKLLPESETDEVFRFYAEVLRVYPRDGTDQVSSHNDLKPQNMRFDGNRIWLVDWESAFLNDLYVDLSIVANFFVRDETQEEAYLSAYFGEPAGERSEYRRARFYLMRQALSMFYASLLLLEASRAGLAIDRTMSTPGFREYHQDLISDEIDMLKAEAKAEYGLIHLREALRNMRTARFEESVAVVGEFHGGP
jgi:aminoglycoside phosphotransferase (APT) family kinase protein